MLEEGGLGEPFGKASSANTVFVSTRFVPITNKRPWKEGRWLGHSSEAWPYEALERGLPRPFAKRRKKLGVGKLDLGIDKMVAFDILTSTILTELSITKRAVDEERALEFSFRVLSSH